ncbi:MULTISPECIES: hypothetical protein [Thermomonosporaceae]|uniref:hypothetical protein n=1 Tax=Thermomonosporaceae TaxID=2012 RepID=UPI00255A8365|nr:MULTISPECIES: hypothetical protein [Thermomonosporaceae]MDL4774490.1 hypothetical protein [Actinomadura xylanilytica]
MNGAHDGDRENPEHRYLPWLIPTLHALVIEVAASLLAGSVLTPFHGTFWRTIGITLTVLVALSVTVGGGLFALFHFNRPLALRLLRRLLLGLTWAARATIWGAGGAAVLAIVLLAGYGVRLVGEQGRPCGRPLDLRILTTPDALTPLRQAAADFAADERHDGCSRYAVTVAAEPGATSVRNGFADSWARDRTTVGSQLVGPQPDIWIPSSTAEYRYAEKALSSSSSGHTPEFERHPVTVGNSPLVLALFGDDNGAVYGGTREPLRGSTDELLESFKEVGLHGIARPIPESSSAALAVTPVLQRAVHAAGLAPAGEEAERFISPAGWLAPDPVALLCKVRAQAEAQMRDAPGKAASPVAAPPRGVAVAVPENVLNDYNAGRALGDGCGAVKADDIPYAQWKLYPYYARDLPSLDHPFVHVRWPGQGTRRRDEAVDAFRTWLKGHPLTSQGFRDRGHRFRTSDGLDAAHPYLNALNRLGNNVVPGTVPGTAAPDAQQALDAIRDARKKVQVALMLDTSGSMGAPPSASTRALGNRLTVAVSFLRSLVSQLYNDDVVGLQTFALPASPGPIRVDQPVRSDLMSAPGHPQQVTDGLLTRTPAYKDAPLADAILAASLPPGRTDLLVVTDGQVSKTNPGLAASLDRLGRFREDHPGVRVTLLLTGPTGCGDSPVKEITRKLAGTGEYKGGCERMGDEVNEEQAARLLSRLR